MRIVFWLLLLRSGKGPVASWWSFLCARVFWLMGEQGCLPPLKSSMGLGWADKWGRWIGRDAGEGSPAWWPCRLGRGSYVPGRISFLTGILTELGKEHYFLSSELWDNHYTSTGWGLSLWGRGASACWMLGWTSERRPCVHPSHTGCASQSLSCLLIRRWVASEWLE